MHPPRFVDRQIHQRVIDRDAGAVDADHRSVRVDACAQLRDNPIVDLDPANEILSAAERGLVVPSVDTNLTATSGQSGTSITVPIGSSVVDAATLTGAVVIALGHHAIGMLGNDEALLAEVRDAGERAGERCWTMPLWDDYRELLKSDVADVKNSGGRAAGVIAGAWFLREFVDGFPWVHLDIAGTAYLEGEGASHAKGPTAVGVRLFTEFLLKRAGA